MIEDKLNEIQGFFDKHVNPDNIAKYSRYFKDGFKGYGIDLKPFEKQKEYWIETWKDEMSLDGYLDLGEHWFRQETMKKLHWPLCLLLPVASISLLKPSTVWANGSDWE